LDKQSIEKKVVELLSNRFEIPFGDDVDYDTDLFKNGFIDSIESVVVISNFEKTFGISISPKDLIDNSMNTVNEMVEFISKILGE
jgi:acyl carrier protein